MYQVRTMFSTTVEAVQCLTYQTGWNVRTCKKETKHTRFWGVREKEFLYVVLKLCAKSQKTMKISLSYSFAVENGSFRHDEMKYYSVCIFGMLRDTLELILWKKADKPCKDQKRSIFIGEECFDRKEYVANTANKHCSRQVLQFRCSWWYSIRFLHLALGDELCYSFERWNRYIAIIERSEQMGWRTRTSALPIRDLRQIAYLLPIWGGFWSGVVFRLKETDMSTK